MASTLLTVRLRSTALLSPYAEPKVPDVALAPRLDDLRGKRIAFWSNRMRITPPIMRVAEKYLREEVGVADVTYVWGYGPHGVEPQEADLDAAASADAVVAASAECGSCTTWLAVASAEIEKRGTPTVSYATEPFANEFARVSKGLGIPYPAVIVINPQVEHPAVVTKEVVKRTDEIRYLLTTAAATLQDEYRDRWSEHAPDPEH